MKNLISLAGFNTRLIDNAVMAHFYGDHHVCSIYPLT